MLWTVFQEHHKVAVLADKEKQRPAKESRTKNINCICYDWNGLIESMLILVSHSPSEKTPKKKTNIHPELAGANKNEKPKRSNSYHRMVDYFQ